MVVVVVVVVTFKKPANCGCIMYAVSSQLWRKCLSHHVNNRFANRLVSYVLGIETSCDDTGLAIVDTNGKVCANVLDSQQQFHTR